VSALKKMAQSGLSFTRAQKYATQWILKAQKRFFRRFNRLMQMSQQKLRYFGVKVEPSAQVGI